MWNVLRRELHRRVNLIGALIGESFEETYQRFPQATFFHPQLSGEQAFLAGYIVRTNVLARRWPLGAVDKRFRFEHRALRAPRNVDRRGKTTTAVT